MIEVNPHLPADGPVSEEHSAAADLLDASYSELHSLARAFLREQRAGHTLQPTALVHEAWIRLFRYQGTVPDLAWSGREHFVGAAAQTMRRILVNHAARRLAFKRGGAHRRVELDEIVDELQNHSGSLIRLDEALSQLARMDPRQAEIIELRFFLRLSVRETADALRVSTRTVEREWRMARAWLQTELSDVA